MLRAEERRTSQEKWIGKELIQTRKQMPCKEMLHNGYGKIQLEKNPVGFGDLGIWSLELLNLLVPGHLPVGESFLSSSQ